MKKLFAGLFLVLVLSVFFPNAAEASTLGKTAFIPQAQKKSSHITLAYKAVKGADGYQIFYIEGYDGYTNAKYKKLVSTKKLTYTTKSLPPGIYSFKVRPVKRVGGKLVYGKASDAISISVENIDFPGNYLYAGMIEKEELVNYAKWIGGMKRVSSKKYPDFCAKGNGVFIGCNYHAKGSVPYCIVKTTDNKSLRMYGVRIGMTRSEVYKYATLPVYNNGNIINVWYSGVTLTYDKNDKVSSMTYRFSSTS